MPISHVLGVFSNLGHTTQHFLLGGKELEDFLAKQRDFFPDFARLCTTSAADWPVDSAYQAITKRFFQETSRSSHVTSQPCLPSAYTMLWRRSQFRPQ
jgi:hypothetical protein